MPLFIVNYEVLIFEIMIRKQVKISRTIVFLLLAGALLFFSCAPKIYGQTKKKKKSKKCGCELILPDRKKDANEYC